MKFKFKHSILLTNANPPSIVAILYIYIITKFKFIDSILSTNSNPQSIVDLLCPYKERHHPPGYKLFVFFPSGIHHICIPAFPFDPPTQSGTYLINILEPVQYHIYAMAFPFDLRCESVTFIYNPSQLLF